MFRWKLLKFILIMESLMKMYYFLSKYTFGKKQFPSVSAAELVSAIFEHRKALTRSYLRNIFDVKRTCILIKTINDTPLLKKKSFKKILKF